MRESDNEGLRRLQGNLEEVKLQQEQKDIQVEEVRVELAKIALEAAEKYQREVVALQPEGQRMIDEVIAPWFENLSKTGIYQELVDRARQGNWIWFSDSIYYSWPQLALRETSELTEGLKPCQQRAELILDMENNPSAKLVELHAASDEVWKAHFYLARSQIVLDRGRVISQGYGSTLYRQHRRIEFDVNKVREVFLTISPEVWVGFGQQIRSGSAWEQIEQSLKPKE